MTGENGMTRKYEDVINFSRNWGMKLDNARWTTVRGQNKLYKVGGIYPVVLVASLVQKRKEYGPASLLRIEFKRIKDFTIGEILEDIGRRTSAQPRVYFYNLLKDFYQLKKWWDGEYTIAQKLVFEYIGRGTYAK